MLRSDYDLISAFVARFHLNCAADLTHPGDIYRNLRKTITAGHLPVCR